MGCDIHIHREKLVDGQWIAGDVWTKEEEEDGSYWHHEEVGGDRNYELFSILAQVRSYRAPTMLIALAPRGLPQQMSKEVSESANRWDGDAHSHSHIYLCELENTFTLLQSLSDYDPYTNAQLKEIIDGLKELDGDEQRIVFWFDN